jgi:hypothetical protein
VEISLTPKSPPLRAVAEGRDEGITLVAQRFLKLNLDGVFLARAVAEGVPTTICASLQLQQNNGRCIDAYNTQTNTARTVQKYQQRYTPILKNRGCFVRNLRGGAFNI